MEFSNEAYINELNNVLKRIDKKSLQDSVDQIIYAWERNAKIITCGNGGSALTASHFINDWVKCSKKDNNKKFKGFCLTDNIGLVTAYGNDFKYENIFSEQCKSILDKEDLLIVISGSGKSKNIIKALIEARNIGTKTLAILGYDGGEAIKLADKSLLIPSFDMQICEDIFIIFGHIVMKQISRTEIICKY